MCAIHRFNKALRYSRDSHPALFAFYLEIVAVSYRPGVDIGQETGKMKHCELASEKKNAVFRHVSQPEVTE